MIRVEQVTKRYGTTVVVDGVDLELPAGGVVSVIGPNGAGKSTLLSVVARLLPSEGGRVTVDGDDVRTTPGPVLARRLGILRQDNHLTVRLTVRDLVTFGRYPHSRGRTTPEDERHVAAALEYLDLEGLAGRYLDELSGGQRQRAFVAMVLAQDTRYVLLDEPLNNLDLRHARGMMRLVRAAADDLGKTVVAVLHDVNFASCWSDRIVAMRDGRVVAQGTPEEVVRPEVLRDVYGTDVDVHVLDGNRVALYYV
ncbi:ABC transporter ATP-binding protein [Cellulosimicrobium sp. CUA-896]|uniref:iron ABC transporter ATP-binding protein n=1 Tax=Cellulosimicrobium sp. CUA-896 TaxID=1517881 RepID=UPI00095BE861|nr:ATP-binding cassette domain-containing protein [Cellulosimicrobium sp. CUA-896]OLT48283.1 iron ABC transporter ATP-binding protein [Cellulosimicrobium sp. CUA-896]